MIHGQCPKCGSDEIYVDVTKSKMGRSARDEMSVTGMISVTLTNYVCADCGFTESYVVDPQARERIKRKWQHIENVQDQHKQNRTQLTQVVSDADGDDSATE
jgi:predicted RNA-binding Zn-ribbon protein involved in translation (DUF1610 family)